MFFSIFWPFKLIGGLARFALNMLVLAACILTVTAFLGDRGWLWSLTTHFRMQYFLIQLLALLLVSLSWKLQQGKGASPISRAERWLTLVFLMFFAGLNLTQIGPYYWPFAKPDAAEVQQTARVKLMHINLYGYLNQNKQSAIQAIRDTDPDMIDLVEYTEPWQRALERSGVLAKYPYHVAGRGHIALYSKRPLMNARLVYANPEQRVANYANIIAQFKLNNEPITVLVAHPSSPTRPSRLEWQQHSFDRWIRERRQLGENLIIVGDLNTAPWSREFERLLKATHLRDSQLGYGIQPTWPMLVPVERLPGDVLMRLGKVPVHPQQGVKAEKQQPSPWLAPFGIPVLGIPIDHVLVSDRVLVLDRHTGPFVGSDHLPVIVSLGLTPRSKP